MTQKDLAKRLGVDESTVSKTFSGEIAPRSKKQLKKWIQVLAISGGERKLLLAVYEEEDDELATRADVRASATDTTEAFRRALDEQSVTLRSQMDEGMKAMISGARARAESVEQPSRTAGDEVIEQGIELVATLDRFADLYRQARYAEAIEVGNRLVDMAPDELEMGVLVAGALEKAGQLTAATERASALLRRGRTKSTDASFAIQILLRAGQRDEAQPYVLQLLERHELDPGTALAYADTLMRANRESEAAPYIEILLGSDDPKSQAAGHYLRGLVMFRSGQTDEAADALHKAVGLDNELWLAHFVIGGMELMAGRHDKTAESWLAITRLKPDAEINGESIHFHIGTAYQLAENTSAAEDQFKAACTKRPTVTGFERLLEVLWKQKKLADMAAAGEEARRRNLRSGLLLAYLGLAYFFANRNCLAAERLRESLSMKDQTLPDSLLEEVQGNVLPLAQARCEAERTSS